MWPFTKPSSVGSELAADMAALRKEMRDLKEAFEDLEAKHHALRGRVYYSRLHKNPLKDSTEDQEATITRDELRRLSGFKPGKPYPHKDS